MKQSQACADRYRALFESGSLAVYSCDLAGNIVDFNRRATELWGRTPWAGEGGDRYCGSYRLYMPDGARLLHEVSPLAQVLSGAVALVPETEVLMERPDGTWRNCIVNVAPLKDARGELSGAINCFYDVTSHKQGDLALRASRELLHTSEVRYRRLFETAQDGVLLLDAVTEKITDANPYIAKLLRISQGDLIGKQLWEIGLFKDIQESKAAMQVLQEKHYIRYDDLPLQTSDGKPIELEFVSNVYTEGERQVIQCNIRDVTARKLLERAAQRDALALVKADRRKDEFLAMLAHELRNPLAPLRTALYVIRKHSGGDGQMHAATEIMERQVAHMVRLVDDLLDVSRVSLGKIELRLERLDLVVLVSAAAENARVHCEAMNHALHVALPGEPIWVQGDPFRLEQAIGNLLRNACKFTDRNGHIEIELKREHVGAVIRVRDNGIGIAAADLGSVFDLFMQADTSLGRLSGGLGIGLTLVKTLIEAHRGSVHAYSKGLGQGSEFVLQLPILEMGATAAPRVLVVDDNRDSAVILGGLLESSGYQVKLAYDGEEALKTAASFLPGIILLDIGLPRIDGYEVARRIRSQPWGADMQIVAITGWGREDDRLKSSAAGIIHHLIKPVAPESLLKLLTQLSAPGVPRSAAPPPMLPHAAT